MQQQNTQTLAAVERLNRAVTPGLVLEALFADLVSAPAEAAA